MPVSNRNFSMLQTRPISSAMPMTVGRTPYYNEVNNVVSAVITKEQPVRDSGTKTMTLINVTHNNKATVSSIQLKNPEKKHEFNPPRPYNPVTLTNITNNDNSSVKIISHNR